MALMSIFRKDGGRVSTLRLGLIRPTHHGVVDLPINCVMPGAEAMIRLRSSSHIMERRVDYFSIPVRGICDHSAEAYGFSRALCQDLGVTSA